MSDPQPDPVEPIGPDFGVTSLGEVSTLYLYDTSAQIALATTPAEVANVFDDIEASVTRIYGPVQADEINGVWRGIEAAINDGDLTPGQIPGFFSYMRFNLGVPSLTAAAVTAAGIAGLILKYKLHLGYDLEPMPLPGTATVPTAPVQPTVTPAPYPTPVPVPGGPAPVPVPTPPVPVPISPPVVPPPVVTPPSPSSSAPTAPAPVAVGQPQTTGQKVVVQAATQLVNQSVTAPGLTPAEAKAISTAIGISVVDVYKVVAQVIDLMLPNLAPGQVPAALTDLFQATKVLESQLDPIISGIRDNGGMATGNQVTFLAEAIQGLVGQIGQLDSELQERAPSSLGTDLDTTKTAVAANTTAITGIEQVLPTLATTTALQGVQTEVTTTVEQLGMTAPSQLGSELGTTTAIAQDALRVAEDAEACCSAQTSRLDDDETQLGGKPNLPNLGKIAGWLFGLGFVATLLDTVVAVFDLPAAFAGTVDDVETLSSWADAAATQAISDTSWASMVAAA